MKKKLGLFLTAIALFSMSLGACNAKTNTNSTSNIPEWSIHDDGHLYHYEEDLGNVIGPKGDQGEQGPQGEQGLPGQNGVDGQNGQDGKDGADGQPGANGQDGKDGNGIDRVVRSNDGVCDTYTFYFTDGSTFAFSIPNAPVRISATPLRDFYYVGEASVPGVTVYAYFADGSYLEVEGFEVSGFDTDSIGKKDVVISFGGQSDAFSVNVVGAPEAIDEVAALMTTVFEQTVNAYHNANGDYIVLNMGDMDTATLEYYCDLLFVPELFEAEADWAADSFSDGTPVDFIDYKCGNIVLEYLVYEVSGYEGDEAGYNGTYLQIQAIDTTPQA
jgi:hypothetical protein